VSSSSSGQSLKSESVSGEILANVCDLVFFLSSSGVCVILNVSDFSIQCVVVQVTTFTLNVGVLSKSTVVGVTLGGSEVEGT